MAIRTTGAPGLHAATPVNPLLTPFTPASTAPFLTCPFPPLPRPESVPGQQLRPSGPPFSAHCARQGTLGSVHPDLARPRQLLSSPIQSPTKGPGELVTWHLKEAPVPALTQICPGHLSGAEDSTSASPWPHLDALRAAPPLPQSSLPPHRHAQASRLGRSSGTGPPRGLAQPPRWPTCSHTAGRSRARL